ncbi:MAG: copper chaperone PCu(A)C [Pseudomonadota bacterium]|nr:copper chaperone PCu(A)C [Pseudomonadota bacterium]
MRLFVLTLGLALAGCEGASPDIAVSDAWARATAPGQSSGAVYATIVNDGAADQLVAVSTTAGNAMLHGNDGTGGVARMRMVADLPIPARAKVQLAPGATHVMLGGLKAPLTAGTHFPLTLRFAKAGPRTVEVAVVAAGAR